MSSNKETPIKTIGFVLIVCLVCAALVSISAVQLKPLQVANKLLDQQTKILETSKLLEVALEAENVKAAGGESKSIVATYNKYVFASIVNLESGEVSCTVVKNDDTDTCYVKVKNFDERRNSRDVSMSEIPENDMAGINRKSKTAVVFLVNNDADDVETVVFPIVGSGLWDLMYGYVGLESDLNTVRSLVYSDHKETPGLGAEVMNPKWKVLWQGKKIYDEQGEPKIKLVKGGAKADDAYAVDALSGATLTSNGVTNTLQFWFDDEGYKPFIKKHRASIAKGGLN